MDVELPDDFKELLESLTGHRVEYLLIGGYAVGFHGYPRATNDIDVRVRISSENAQVAALTDFGFSAQALSADLFVTEDNIIRMGNPPLRIEIATTISGVDFAECSAARVMPDFDGVLVPVIGREHLIANKLASGRMKDTADVEFLIQQTKPRKSKP